MIVTQVAFHFELVNWCGIVHADFRLLRIVSDAHSDVIVATFAPNVVRHLEANDYDALVDLAGPLPQSVCPHPFVQAAHFGVVIRGIV